MRNYHANADPSCHTISIIYLCIEDGTGKSRLSDVGSVFNTIDGAFLILLAKSETSCVAQDSILVPNAKSPT